MKLLHRLKILILPAVVGFSILSDIRCDTSSDSIRIGVFTVDVSPPIGSPVAYARARSITDSLKAKGIVLLSDKKPVVLCVVDWLGIANEGQDA